MNTTTKSQTTTPEVTLDVAPLQTFLATRFYPPRREGEYVERNCVEKLIKDVTEHRLALVKAPAGYGKTTTLSGCYWALEKSEGVAAWLNLTDFDGSLAEFAGYVAQAFSWKIAKQTSQSQQWGSGWFDIPTIQSLSFALCNAADMYVKPAYLFLDDFDAIIGTDAERFIYQVLRDAPANLHVIIGSRTAPSFGVGRLRMQGLLVEIGVEQLRFTVADTTQFLGLAAKVEIDSQLVSLAIDKTEGWPAGLQLVAISLAHSDNVHQLLSSFNGEIQEVGEFLAEDVLETLDPKLTDFLLQTSVLRRFSVPLCNAITGRNDSRQLIDELERHSLFIFSLDGEQKWYRYQSLFSAFLLRNLKDRQPQLVSSLYIKASNWFVNEGLVVQSVHYALSAEDYLLAAKTLNNQADALLRRGLFDTLYRLISRLPKKVLQLHPSLCLWQASYLICNRKFHEAQPILKHVEEHLNVIENDSSSHSAMKANEIKALNTTLLRGRLMLAQFMDDMPSLERLCKDVLSKPNESNGVLSGVLQTSLLHAQREQYRLDEVELRDSLAHEAFSRGEQPLLSVGLESVLGPTYVQRGECDTAEACYRRALLACENNVTDGVIMRAGISALLGELQLERLDIDKARELLVSNSDAMKGMGFVENLIASYVGGARLAGFDGEFELADNILREGIDCAITQSLERLRWCCVDERIRQHLRRKDVWGALRVSSDSGLPSSDSKLYPVGEFTTTREAMAMAWARTALASGRPKDAIKLLKRWLRFVVQQRCIRSQIRLSILTAQVYQALGEIRSALRVLVDVMPHIAKSGMLFCLIEEDESLRSLIMQICKIEGQKDESELSFALRVQQALDSDLARKVSVGAQVLKESEPVEDVQCEALNPKEIEILHLVSRSLRNKEIADRLGLTEGTVKWYLQQIYDKFDVRRRFSALERARTLGYL